MLPCLCYGIRDIISVPQYRSVDMHRMRRAVLKHHDELHPRGFLAHEQELRECYTLCSNRLAAPSHYVASILHGKAVAKRIVCSSIVLTPTQAPQPERAPLIPRVRFTAWLAPTHDRQRDGDMR